MAGEAGSSRGLDVEQPRRTQERGAATRAALLDAALESLIDQGYADTTTIEVVKRAGVSRGAQLHHFPTKAELLTAAVYHLCERRITEFRKAFVDAEPGSYQLEASIDLLWSMFRGPTFAAWAELWLAARTDVELRRQVLEMDRRFVDASQALFVQLFPPEEGIDPAFYELGRAFAYTFLSGLALGGMVADDPVYERQMIDALKGISRMLVPHRPEKETSGEP